MRKILCFFGFHDYSRLEGLEQWPIRKCKCCGKKQYSFTGDVWFDD